MTQSEIVQLITMFACYAIGYWVGSDKKEGKPKVKTSGLMCCGNRKRKDGGNSGTIRPQKV